MVSPTVFGRAILKVTEGGLKSSIHRAIWEQVFLPLGSVRREMAKVMVDGLFARIAEGMAAVALYIWLSRLPSLDIGLDLSWISWIIVAAVLLWIVLTRYLAQRGCSEIDERDSVIRLPDS
jgi:ATP/ADP translocase